MTGIYFKGTAEIFNRLVKPPDSAEHNSLIHKNVGIVAVEFQSLAVSLNSFHGAIGVKIIVSQLNPRITVFRFPRHDLLKSLNVFLIVNRWSRRSRCSAGRGARSLVSDAGKQNT